jgi:ferredoxin
MSLLRYIFINVIGTLMRGFSLPCKTGIIRIGNPNRNSPVFITCNYSLTVERVKRALREMDCYLLVANSKGINVWCASTGGHFNNHSVISALKTSGIEELVDHRNVILPQLAASGVELKVIKKRTGWNVIWGPVYAKDIPQFLKNNYKKSSEMREVRFPLAHRLEMGIMWAFPFSVIVGLLTFLLWRRMFLPVFSLMWILPLAIFISFPLYSRLFAQRKTKSFSSYTVFFDFSRIPLFLEAVFISFLVVYGMVSGNFSWSFILRWGFVSLVIILVISVDLMGSTPIFKSGLHEDRLLRVVLDEKRCRGAGFCEQVCPRNCYEVDKKCRIATMPRADQCVQCGACIVQCPFDALYFESPTGDIIPPETIRKFKLNLLGKRIVKVG